MKIPKKIAALLTVTLVAGSVSANIASADTKNESLLGAGRWETAIKVSQNGWTSSKEAVIVNENSIADALSATPFADAKNAPILLTQKNKLDDRTKAELKRLGVSKVYLIGGESVLNKDVEAALKAQGITVDRIWGSERYQTSLEIAKRLDKIKDVSEIAVVNGDKGLADAVSIGAPAAQKDMPIILADPKQGTSVSDEFIKNAGIKTSYVIGGDAVISNAVSSKLPNAKRLAGIDRNETNSKVVSEFYKGTDLKNAYVAKDGMKNKDQLIDALAVGVLAAKNQSPVILVSNKLSAPQKEVLNTKSLDKVTQVGGNGNEAAFNELKALQAKTTHTAKTVAELKSAVAKADANDVINFNQGGAVSEDIIISTKNAISVNFEGTYKGKVTINMPNGDVTNNGTMDKVIVDDIKVGTFTNNGKITSLTVNDNNGGKIVNGKDGKIEEIKVPSGAKAIAIENKGTVSTIKNDSKDTILNNEGKVDKIEGDERPSIEGTKPGGGSGGGGSSSGGGSTTPSTTASVSTEGEFKKALENTSIKTINITKNIENISETIKVTRKVTINGGGKTLSFIEKVSSKQNTNGKRNGLLIQSDDVVINDLNIKMTQIDEWTGAYGIQVYDSERVVLNNYIGKHGDAALLVNGSKVELTGTITVSDNEFGGIEVSKGTEAGLRNSELKVTGTLVNATEKRTEPTIWSVVDKGTVNWNGKVGHGEVEDKKLYYYIDDNKANGDTYINDEKELTLDQDGSYRADFEWSSTEGIGNKLVETKELAQGRYAYYSDGAYLRFKVKRDGAIKNFSQVFQDMTLTTNKHEVGHKVDSIKGKSEGRQYEDWTGDKGTSYTSLQTKDDKYVFYGVRQGNLEGKKVTRTVGFGENEIRTIDMRLIPKSELEFGTYTVTVEVLQQDGENFGTIDYTFEVQDTGSSI